MNQALKEIREAIRKGKLKPGDRLVEMQLAEEMHISRFPIREALRYLEKEGLVETKPFKGTYVAKLTERDMEELYSLRSAISMMKRLLNLNPFSNPCSRLPRRKIWTTSFPKISDFIRPSANCQDIVNCWRSG
jgi:DNA-binding transcriptional regulator YhcF (GntR family)